MKTFARRSAVAALIAAISAHPVDAALNFNLVEGSDLQNLASSNPSLYLQVKDGFQQAANLWTGLLNDDITVNLSINYSALGSGVLGSTSISRTNVSYTSTRAALVLDATSAADAVATANLPTGNSLRFYINNNDGTVRLDNDTSGLNATNNNYLSVPFANLKALGQLDPLNAATDASITFSSSFSWDFNRSNGISSGQYDFVGVAAHEIGHALGFVSGVDRVDTNTTSNLDRVAVLSVLDLYRRSAASIAVGPDVLDVTYGTASFFCPDCQTNHGAFSTGSVHGDGRQASHWKDSQGLGIMDPTSGAGEFLAISALDLRALDAIGYDRLFTGPHIWTGDQNRSWTTNNAGDTNWSSDQHPYYVLVAPDIVFSSSGTYGGALTLDGSVTVNSITVNQDAVKFATGTQDLANPGTPGNSVISLGTGGMIVNHVGTNADNLARNVRFAAGIALTASQTTTIQRTGTSGSAAGGSRDTILAGSITGSNVNLVLDNAGLDNSNAIELAGDNAFTGAVRASGFIRLSHTNALGASANTVHTAALRAATLRQDTAGSVVTGQNIVLGATYDTALIRAGAASSGTWELTGAITGGAAARTLRFTGTGDRRFILSSTNQTFASAVNIDADAEVVIAGGGAGNIAWGSAGAIALNTGYVSPTGTSTALLLRGPLKLNQNISITDVASTAPLVTLGQINNGPTPAAATFSGNINVAEDDYRSLRLTADAGGSAHFTGALYGSGGYGLSKIGAGSVVLTGRVSGTLGGNNSFGNVQVASGSLNIQSPYFHASNFQVLSGASASASGAGVFTASAIDVQSGASVTIANTWQTSGSVAKTGAGTLTVSGPQNHAANSTLTVNGGSVTFNSNAGSPGVSSASANLFVDLLNGQVTFNADQHLRGLSVDENAANTFVNIAEGVLVTIYGNSPSDGLPPSRQTIESIWMDVALGAAGGSGIRLAGGSSSFTGISMLLYEDQHGESAIGLLGNVRGDLNADFTVDLGDVSVLLGFYNKNPGDFGFNFFTAFEGDLNYDGIIDLGDLSVLLSNYGASYDPFAVTPQFMTMSSMSTGPSAGFALDFDMAFQLQSLGVDLEVFGFTVVPEPAGLSLLALAGLALLPRRRRRCR